MGAVRMRVQTADKNITIIHTTPVHQLTSWEDRRFVFIRNKSIIKTYNIIQSKHSGYVYATGPRILFQWRNYGLWTLIYYVTVSYKHSFCLLKMLTDGVVWIIVMFLSDSHSDGTHSLQSIHCWDSDVMLDFSKSDEETNSSLSWMPWGWVHFQRNNIFGWNIALIR